MIGKTQRKSNLLQAEVGMVQEPFGLEYNFMVDPVAHRKSGIRLDHFIEVTERDIQFSRIFGRPFYRFKIPEQQGSELSGQLYRSGV